MSLQFITGASGAGKSTYIYRQIIARSEKEPEGRFFILVPDQFTMQTQKDLVSLHDRKGIMNIDVLSFGRLTHRIFEEMGGNRLPMLDDTGKSLISRRVAAGNRRTSSGFCPTSLPIPSCVICGQEKLHSMISAPACVEYWASRVHSSSVRPIMEEMINLSG